MSDITKIAQEAAIALRNKFSHPWPEESDTLAASIIESACEKAIDFYSMRFQSLHKEQRNMRDPERKVVCDILANGYAESWSWAAASPATASEEDWLRRYRTDPQFQMGVDRIQAEKDLRRKPDSASTGKIYQECHSSTKGAIYLSGTRVNGYFVELAAHPSGGVTLQPQSDEFIQCPSCGWHPVRKHDTSRKI